jgi:hypothetical protein
MQFGHFYNQNANEFNQISFDLFFSFFDSKYSTLEQTMLSSLYCYIFYCLFFWKNYCLEFGPGDEVPKKTNLGGSM